MSEHGFKCPEQDGNLSSEEAEELLREELQKELKDITVY